MRLPPGAVFALGRLAGSVLCTVARGRRRHYEEVLPYVCKTVDRERQREIIREAFIQLCQSEFEMLRYPVLNPGLIEATVACKGLEHLDASLAGGNGAMLMFAHFGSNQMIMPALGYRGYVMSQLSAPSSKWLEVVPGRKYSSIEKKGFEIREFNEKSLPVKHINVFGSLKEAFACIKRNEILGVAIDGGGGKTRVEIPFLGKKALFSTGAMEIGLRTGCPVHPTFIIRSRRGPQTLIIEPPLVTGTPGDPDAVRRAMTLFVERLESYVYSHPEHYVNFLALRHYMASQGDTPFLTS
jgi:KDO2-lipid IV(A) lauroyltransferase